MAKELNLHISIDSGKSEIVVPLGCTANEWGILTHKEQDEIAKNLLFHYCDVWITNP